MLTLTTKAKTDKYVKLTYSRVLNFCWLLTGSKTKNRIDRCLVLIKSRD